MDCCMCSGEGFNGWMEGSNNSVQYGLGFSDEDGTLVMAIEVKDEDPVILGFPINFCPYCGRKIVQPKYTDRGDVQIGDIYGGLYD